jgi:DNA-binding LytR/AlgR family response regulator
MSDDRLMRAIARIKNRCSGKEGIQDLKPLLSRLSRVLEKKDAHVRYLRASFGKTLRLVPVEDVLFIRAQSKYTSVATRDGEFLMRTPLSVLISQLDPERFWQIHRSIIVNISKVVSIKQTGREAHVLTVRDSQELLPVSRSFIHQLKHQ